MENLTPIKGFENYLISECGTIINAKGKTISHWFNNEKGYPRVSLYKNGKKTNKLVHCLVALTHVPNPHPRKYKIVLHKDDNPRNPHKSNLSWGTLSMNMKDMIQKGRGKNQFQPKG